MRRASDETLAVTYLLRGDLGSLRIPPFELPRRGDKLWQHTCFEAFVRSKGEAAYHEFNFSPSSEWAAYRFRNYREAAPFADESPLMEIKLSRDGQLLQLDAVVRIAISGTLQLALSAVLEYNDGTLAYWALKHPAGKPDFHHAEAFALTLDNDEIRN